MCPGKVGVVVRAVRMRKARGHLCRLVTPLIVGPSILDTGGGCPFGAARRCI